MRSINWMRSTLRTEIRVSSPPPPPPRAFSKLAFYKQSVKYLAVKVNILVRLFVNC